MTRVSNFKERYQALQPFPLFPGEETWIDRLRTWEDFVEGGHLVADFLANLFRAFVRERGKEQGSAGYDEKFRQLCPALHDLLMEYFEEELPWTERRRKDMD